MEQNGRHLVVGIVQQIRQQILFILPAVCIPFLLDTGSRFQRVRLERAPSCHEQLILHQYH